MAKDYPRTLKEIRSRFRTDSACAEYLATLRWPDGWVCPRCGGRNAWNVRRHRWRCGQCRYEMSVTAGTIFQDSRLPLTTWFQALWHVAGRGRRISARSLQRVLDLGSYRTAWAMLHKLRRAMGRPSLVRLDGLVEVDTACSGGEKDGAIGHLTQGKALIIVGVEVGLVEGLPGLVEAKTESDGPAIGRVCLRRIPDLTRASLHGFIAQAVQPGSTVRTNGLSAYRRLQGYIHDHQARRNQETDERALWRVHRIVSLLKRWLLRTYRRAVGPEHLDDYLSEFTFRFNNRGPTSNGALFHRLASHAVHVAPAPFATLVQPPPIGGRWRKVNMPGARLKSK